jgi:Arc/MetJ-type ribon-helix-helix transcriptional regulator
MMSTLDEKFSSDGFTTEQRERTRAHIRARGMTFEVFLPEGRADWLRAKIAAGVFKDAREAAFVAFQEMQELDKHPEVRQALLKAMTQDAMDSGPGVSLEEMRERHQARLRKYAESEPPSK